VVLFTGYFENTVKNSAIIYNKVRCMRNINSEIKIFLETHRVSVLSVGLTNGSIHGSALYYSFAAEPFHIFFSTLINTRKCSSLITGDTMKASVVIGFQEKEWVTFQAEGTVQIIQNGDYLKKVRTNHFKKFPENKGGEEDEMSVFLEFTPTWWRFSDFTIYPIKYIQSDATF
jgi:general stress protein 26